MSEFISHDDHIKVSAIRDITERKLIKKKLLNTIIQTEEEERKRVAQELHDGLGPILSTVKLLTQTYFFTAANEEFKSKLESEINSSIDEAINNISIISNKLSPQILNDFGLKVALERFIQKLKNVSNLKISLNCKIAQKIKKDVEISLYRVVAELINNTIKYADAENVIVEIEEKDNQIFADFIDDGSGLSADVVVDEEINASKTGLGLFNIKNRIESLNGDFKIINLNIRI